MKTKNFMKSIATLFALLVLVINVFAQTPPPITTVGPALCQEGTFTVPVTVTGFNNVANISLRLNYDPTKIAYQSVVVNPLIPAVNTLTTPPLDLSGQFRLSYTGATGITLPDNTVLFTLTFTVVAGVTSITTPLSWSILQGDCDYAPPAPGSFSPTISPANFLTYFIGGNVTIKPKPTITGPNSVCPGSTGNIYSTTAGMTGYTWTISAGGTISAGAGTNSITVTWNTAGAQTVSVNYTDANSCSATIPTSYPVTVTNAISPQAVGPVNVCAGIAGNVYTADPGMTNYIWTVVGGTITAGGTTTSNTATVTWNTVGAQSITVNYTPIAGCTTTPVPLAVTVNALPVPTISGSASVCIGSTGNIYTTQTAMTGYIWTVSAGGTITAGAGTNAITVSWNTAGAQTISINYTNASGCTAAAPVPLAVTVNALPVPTITGVLTSCAGTAGIVYTTEPGMTAYVWTVSAGGIITAGAGTNAITVTWNTVGPQTISVNYTNASLCTTTIPTVINVTVNALPVPTITGLAAVCTGVTGVTYTTEAGMTVYTWTVSAGGTITAGAGTNIITVSWNTAGPQTVSVNYSNINLCTAATATVYNVTVNTLPLPAITGPASTCLNSTGNVYTTQAGMTAYTWSVSAGGMITSGAGTNSITVTWIASGPQSVSVNYTDVNNCSSVLATTYTVTVNPLPVPTITGLASVCTGVTGIIYLTEASMTGYTWTISAGGTITSGAGTNSVTVNWNTTGLQTLSVTYTNANGCVPSIVTNYSVNVSNTVTPSLSGLNNACSGTTAVVYTTDPGMTNYIWTVSAGGAITAGTGTNSITVTWNTPGAQSVTVDYIPLGGCVTIPAILTVTVNALPVPTITGDSSVCDGEDGNIYTTESGMSAYLWTVSAGGTITDGAGTDSITVTWNTVGPQTVSVNYTNSNTCNATTATVYNVTVNPLPVPTINGPASACINSTGNAYSTETGMSAYIWTVSAGGTITSGTGTNSISVTWNTVGSQNVSVNYTNSNTCTAATATAYNVTVNPLPVPTITGTDSVCEGSTGNAYSTETGMTAYVWTVSSGGIITSGAGTASINVTWNTAGSKTVSVNYSNTNSCTAASPTIFNVTVNPEPSTPVISVNGNTLTSSSATGNQWYLDGNIIPGETNQTYIATQTGNYTVIVTLLGCSSDVSNSVIITGIDENNENISFSVTPNPSNGIFYLTISGLNEIATLNIYNMSGQTIYTEKLNNTSFVNKPIDLKSYFKGMYFIRLVTDNYSLSEKIIIE